MSSKSGERRSEALGPVLLFSSQFSSITVCRLDREQNAGLRHANPRSRSCVGAVLRQQVLAHHLIHLANLLNPPKGMAGNGTGARDRARFFMLSA
ncbi:MAG: hypothetical protein VKJ05_04575 [Synechococcaceae cyanobacterium]|nr:hypothetical protein [Synechococcaceae cyanobacterium]